MKITKRSAIAAVSAAAILGVLGASSVQATEPAAPITLRADEMRAIVALADAAGMRGLSPASLSVG